MDHTIKIPDNGKPHKIKYHDKVYFKFTTDDETFSFKPPNAFTPPAPSGPFPKGKKIGPFSPTMKNTTVTFCYDNSDKSPIVGMHSILIGD